MKYNKNKLTLKERWNMIKTAFDKLFDLKLKTVLIFIFLWLPVYLLWLITKVFIWLNHIFADWANKLDDYMKKTERDVFK